MSQLPRWVVALALAHAGACGGQAPQAPQAPPSAPPAATTRLEPSEPPAIPDAPLDHFEPDPEAQKSFLASFGEPARDLVFDAAPPKVTLLALVNTARGEVKDPESEAEVWSAKLETGQRATRAVSIPGGACVTVIGQGGLGLIEVDLFLTISREGEPVVIGADRGEGPMAILGGRAGCLRAPSAGLDVDLSVRARTGEGLVLVRMYTE